MGSGKSHPSNSDRTKKPTKQPDLSVIQQDEFHFESGVEKQSGSPQHMTPATILRLQSTIGNQAVMRMIATQQKNKPSTAPTLQRHDEEMSDASVTAAALPSLQTAPTIQTAAAGDTVVQRAVGYQTKMEEGGSAQVSDETATTAAASATAADYPVSESYGKAGMGILTPVAVPREPAEKGMKRFEQLRDSRTRKHFPGYYGDIENTWAWKSLDRMRGVYSDNLVRIPEAEGAYNNFTKLSEMGTRGAIKVMSLREQLGFTGEMNMENMLTDQEKEALKEAGQDMPVAQESVKSTGGAIAGAAATLSGASKQYAASLKGAVINKLKREMLKQDADRTAIYKTIKDAAAFASFVESAAGVIAGGAGAVSKLAPLASPAGVGSMTARASAAVKDEASFVKDQAGLLANIVTFGMTLYYGDELAKIEKRRKAIAANIAQEEAQVAFLQAEGHYKTWIGAVEAYKDAVAEFVAAIDRRREQLAIIGRKADEIAQKKGDKTNNISETLLYSNAVMETRPMIQTGVTAGQEAQSALNTAYSGMSARRGRYQTGGWSPVYSDNSYEADHQMLYQMRVQTSNWLAGAEIGLKELNDQIGTQPGEDGEPLVGEDGKPLKATGIWAILELIGITDY